MQIERWATLSPLLDELLELTGHARARRLAEIEDSDPSLARELEGLMALEEDRPDFMSQPVVDASLFSAQPGQEIGPYRLVSPIGEGGMGQVWLAVRADGLYERRVALKLLRPGLGDAGLHARFTRERQILARLGHAHIARLLDAGISEDGQPYLALDYVRGDPITDYARARGLDLRARLQLFAQVCAAVSHAHANLVVHRDLKPSNILVTSAGEVCLLDFGIAKLLDQDQSPAADITRTGSRTFTLHYAAPEQLRGEVITTMTDVYALGVVLYELLTDSRPYELTRHSDAAWEEAILGHEPGRPSQVAARAARESGSLPDKRRARLLAGDLDNIVLKALSKVPEQRYSSVEALAQDLRRHLEGQPVHARAQSLPYRARKYLRRHAIGLGMGVGISSVLAVALAIVSWQASRAVQEASRAQAMQDFVIGLFEKSGQTGNQGVDVRALLDAGIARADTELMAQPRARAELIGLIARLRSGLGDDTQALGLLDRQQEVLRSLGNAAPANLQLDSAALRARSLRELGRQRECLERVGPVQEQATREARTWPAQAAELLSQLGRCHAQLRDAPAAANLFRTALQLRGELPDGGALVAESQNDLALLDLEQGEAVKAERDLRAALSQLRNSGGEQNALGVEIWRNLGAAYATLRNPLEAKAAYRQALQIALGRFGNGHPRTGAVQSELAGVLIGTGELREAEQLMAQVQDNLLARWGVGSAPLADEMSLRGMVALERDEPAQADQLLGDAVQSWRRLGALGDHAWDLCHRAQAQSELGHQDDADASRRECLALMHAQRLPGESSAIVHIVQAALDRHDLVSARSWLAHLPVNPEPDPPEVLLARARLAQMAREPDAGARVAAALSALPDDRSHRRQRWQARSLAAAQACLSGHNAEGVDMRRKILGDASQAEPEHLRQLRRLAQLAAACGRSG
jgi:serine/threonine-protein kinase